MSNTAKVINLFEHNLHEKQQEGRDFVKADLDDGFIRLANTLNEALCLNPAKLSAREYQLVHAIFSKTYR